MNSESVEQAIGTGAVPPGETLPGKKQVRRAVVSSTIGNALEWFDFAIYGFFAAIISKVFFPSQDPSTSFLIAMGTFGVGFVVRPIGGILLAMYADRVGRQRALSLLILMMAAGSLVIGITPSHATIGIAAPLIVVAARIVQGLSVGGEFASATAILYEYAPANRRMFFASFQMCSQALATVLATLCGFALGSLLSPENLTDWGWRIPFLLGALIGPVGFYIRRHVAESPEFAALKRAHAATERVPFMKQLRENPVPLACAFFLIMPATAAVFLWFIYIPGAMVSSGRLTLSSVMLSACICNAVLMVLYLVAGRLADRFGWSRISLPAMIVSALATYPLLERFYAAPSEDTLFQAQLVSALVLAFMAGPIPGAVARMFPVGMRATGIAISQNLAVTLFGGLGPLTVGWLVGVTNDPLSAAYYIIGIQIAGAALVWFCLKRDARILSRSQYSTQPG